MAIPAEMIRGADAYANGSNDPPTSGEIGMPPGMPYIVNRGYLVDGGTGLVNIFCRFGNLTSGMPDSHLFRYIDGKFRQIHTLSVNMGGAPSRKADDNCDIVGNWSANPNARGAYRPKASPSSAGGER